jgi:hypothetical protein
VISTTARIPAALASILIAVSKIRRMDPGWGAEGTLIDRKRARRYGPPGPADSAGGHSRGPVGRSQVVRQRILIPPFGGSNPPAPASNFKLLWITGFVRLDAGYHRGITEDQEIALQKIDTMGLPDPRWMSLLEALRHIESVLNVSSISANVSSVSAQVALKKKIGRDELPVKWADARGPRDIPGIQKLALSQLVLSTPGLAPDGMSLRPLLVLRSAVLAAWPLGRNETDLVHESSQVGACQAAQWMSLVEATDHIRIEEDCDSIEALRQLKKEIGDGMVPVQWEDSQEPKDCPDPQHMQRSEWLLFGTGFAPDNHDEYRPLLVERSAVQRLWPLSSNPTKGSAPTGSTSTTQPKKSPRRKVDDDQILSAARDIYRKRENDPPNMDESERLIRQRLGGGKREDIRKILKQEEFAHLRRASGNQPKG